LDGWISDAYSNYEVLEGAEGEQMRTPRSNYGAALKAEVALAALKVEKTSAEPAEQFGAHPNQITQRKAQQLERATDMFATPERAQTQGSSVEDLEAEIGQLTMVNDFLSARSIRSRVRAPSDGRSHRPAAGDPAMPDSGAVALIGVLHPQVDSGDCSNLSIQLDRNAGEGHGYCDTAKVFWP